MTSDDKRMTRKFEKECDKIKKDKNKKVLVSNLWKEYQEMRYKRMAKAGLEPIPLVRYHGLRHISVNIWRYHLWFMELLASYKKSHLKNKWL